MPQMQNYPGKGNVRSEKLDTKAQDSKNRIGDLEELLLDRDAKIQELYRMVHDKDVHIENLSNIIHAKDERIISLQHSFDEIEGSFFWKLTKVPRYLLDRFKHLIKKNDYVYLLFRTIKKCLTGGPKQAAALWKSETDILSGVISFEGIVPAEEIKRQKETVFDRDITFSILVPLYNTPRQYLAGMIHSVMGQTYGKWELCLADGSDDQHRYVRSVCKKLMRADKRIRYCTLEKNLGISENTNACLKIATGDYIGLLDHDDLLHPSALYECMRKICGENADFMYSDEASFHVTPMDTHNTNFKPDFAPDTLRSYNYICHFTVFSKSLLEKAGGLFRKEYDGSQDYDMILRLTEKAKHIAHIQKVMYYWRSHSESTSADVANKPYIIDAAKGALAAHLQRIGLKGEILDARFPSTYRIRYEIVGNPLVSIIIPNKDHTDDLTKCLNSIRGLSTWKNWEVIVVENNSVQPSTFDYYKRIEADKRIRVVTWEKEFNYSAINNFGASFAKGEFLLLLNNDIEVITPDWLEQMIMFAQRKDVGAVGAMLYYPDNTIQHGGVIVGIGGVAGHSHKGFMRGHPGYVTRLSIAQNLSAVTGACLMTRREVWEEVHGLDEKYAVAFNDVDFCLRIREAGYLIIWTPFAELYHYESKSRGYEDTPEKIRRFEGETAVFQERWGHKILAEGDPYYNPNLTLEREDFSRK